jgi:hypothetical protein
MSSQKVKKGYLRAGRYNLGILVNFSKAKVESRRVVIE